MNKRILIVARNFNEAEEYRSVMTQREPELFKRAQIVTSQNSMYGLNYAEVHCIGHWRDNPEWLLIAELARYRGFELKEVPEWR
jgi:hypothetical protein